MISLVTLEVGNFFVKRPAICTIMIYIQNLHNCILILLFLSLLLQSCMCSRANYNEKVEHDGAREEAKDDGITQKWMSISDIGYPLIPDSIPSEIYERICYSISYNGSTRQPNWVMWHLLGEHVMKRKDGVWNEYMEDPNIKGDCKATLSDYNSSGYDRGHMCPGGDCNWTDEGRYETFFLSNICPQNPNLNRGDWKEIEIACRYWAQKYRSVYIVCGPIFFKSQEHVRIGPNMIPVPEAFFKVILCFDELSPKGIGFICRNTDGNRKKDFYVNSIRQVERITGYKFFPCLDNAIKEVVYDMDDINNW